MNKLTAEKCRQFIVSMKSEQDRNQLSITGEYQLQALEIALPILEQQESDCDIFIVMRNPGKVPDIKRPVGDLADYLLQLYQHNPDAVCDVVTYRFSGISGQWVQDGRELLAMAGVVLEQQEKGNDGWIEWGGNLIPAGVRGKQVQVSYSDGTTESAYSGLLNWGNGAGNLVIAYRVIENDGREG